MERTLASIQTVSEVHPIPGADAIERIQVQGWSLIAKKGEFTPGSLCVFFEIDSILPETEWSEFLRAKDFRVKTMKLGKFGVISQGLALPLSILPIKDGPTDYSDGLNFPVFTTIPYLEGQDVTELLGVTKYEPQESFTNLRMGGSVLKPFISGVPKTDEMRIQSATWILDRMAGKWWYATLKYDGSSFTAVYMHDKLRVASRNCELEDDGNIFYEVAKKYDLETKLATMPNIVIQGELVGPGIQKNRMGFTEHKLFLFNAYDFKTGQYLDIFQLKRICNDLKLDMVEVIDSGKNFNFTIEQMTEMVKGVYPGTTHPREGLVFRPQVAESDPLLGQLSFKCINADYLLKIGE